MKKEYTVKEQEADNRHRAAQELADFGLTLSTCETSAEVTGRPGVWEVTYYTDPAPVKGNKAVLDRLKQEGHVVDKYAETDRNRHVRRFWFRVIVKTYVDRSAIGAEPATVEAMEPGFADHAELEEIAPRLHVSSRNSKLGRIPNMSLAPGRTCSPDACRHCLNDGCYARASYNRWQNVRTAWDDNTWLAVHDLPAMEAGFSALFQNKMTAPRFFRVHVGGDFVSREYAEMWARIAARAPWTLFLAFTKQFDNVRGVDFPANFTLILSDWPGMEIPADLRAKYHVAWLDDGTRPAETFPADAMECPGHCDTCGACWQCDRDTIFHKH